MKHESPDTAAERIRRTSRRITLGVVLANAPGAVFCTVYFTFLDQPQLEPQLDYSLVIGLVLTACLVVLGVKLGAAWSRDLRNAELLLARGEPLPEADKPLLRRKLLNAPLVNTAVTLFNWTVASLIMSAYFYFAGSVGSAGGSLLFESFRLGFGIFVSGLGAGAVVYFVTDGYMRQLRPFFFPDGSLARSESGFRLTVRRRLTLAFLLVSVGPAAVLAVILHHKLITTLPAEAVDRLTGVYLALGFVLAVLFGAALLLSRLVAASIAEPIQEMESAMTAVRRGNLAAWVPVRDADELGVLADSFNEMTDGLRERQRLQHSLDLAREVQQSLLPGAPPGVPGLDAAGTSIYCDETGGDYYDYFTPPGMERVLAAVVGDVSDHGLPSALLMTTARAFIRREVEGFPAAEAVSNVNHLLCRDVEESGRFMTMFLALVDAAAGEVAWVSAGHDPALLYDPGSDAFMELTGRGPALGLVEDWEYAEFRRSLEAGQILVVGTDGIWEARDPSGRMFGKERLRRVVRERSGESAAGIVEAVVAELGRHAAGRGFDDDVTLVVIKAAG